VELPMLQEPVVALMGAGFLKQGFVNVMATRAFQDSTTRGFDSRLASFQRVSLLHDSSFDLRPVPVDRASQHTHTMKTLTCQTAASSKGAFHWMRPLSKKEGYDHRIPTNGANQPIWDNKPN
jgi:hypothetical protein